MEDPGRPLGAGFLANKFNLALQLCLDGTNAKVGSPLSFHTYHGTVWDGAVWRVPAESVDSRAPGHQGHGPRYENYSCGAL